MKRASLVCVWAFLTAFVYLAGCDRERPTGGPPAEGPGAKVKVALLTPLSGEVQDLGKEILGGAQIAIDEHNAQGSGPAIELLVRDDEMSAARAGAHAVSAVRQDGAIAVIAGGTSAAAKGQLEALKGQTVAVVTPSATSTGTGSGYPNFFRVIPSNRAQARALAEHAATKLKAKKACVIAQQDDYSTDLKDAFAQEFKARGGSIGAELVVESAEADFRTHILRASSGEFDVILVAAQHVGVARFLVRATELVVKVPVLSGETAYTQKLLDVVGRGPLDNFYLVGPPVSVDAPTAEITKFMTAYEARFKKKPGIYGCYAYDAAAVLARCVRQDNAVTGEKLIAALRAMKSYPGITGAVTFDENGDVRRDYRIYIVKGGKFQAAE